MRSGSALSYRTATPIPTASSAAQTELLYRGPLPSSPSSAASGSCSDDQASVTSTTPSSAPSVTPVDYGYELHCEFEFLGCNVTFHPTATISYTSHAASHFLKYRPPRKTCCIFCNREFEHADRDKSWRQRMQHIADHFHGGLRVEHTRPDFHVIEYMRKKNILSVEDYKVAIRFSERPYCDGLVDRGYRPPERKWEEDRRIVEIHNQAKEDRDRRRAKDAKKGREAEVKIQGRLMSLHVASKPRASTRV